MDDGERRMRELLEQIGPAMLSTHDVDGRYVAASQQARALLGREPDDLVGLDAYALHHPDDVTAVQTGHVTLVATPHAIVVDYRLRHADGSYVPVRSVAWTDRDPTSAVTHLVVLTVPRDHLTEEAYVELQQVPVATAQRVATDVLGA